MSLLTAAVYRYYALANSLNTRSGNASNSYETVFLLANAALSAAAAKNVEAAISTHLNAFLLSEAVVNHSVILSGLLQILRSPTKRSCCRMQLPTVRTSARQCSTLCRMYTPAA